MKKTIEKPIEPAEPVKAVDPVKPQPEADLKLAHAISFRWRILFALPTICSSIFSNLYTAVDGAFVARWIHTDALSAINITMPMTYLASALGMMFGIGGNALTYGTIRRAQTDFIVTSGISDWALQFKTGCRSEFVIIDVCGP